MSEKKPPHQRMTDKNNGLSDTQEVLYQEEFNKADQGLKVDTKTGKKHKQ